MLLSKVFRSECFLVCSIAAVMNLSLSVGLVLFIINLGEGMGFPDHKMSLGMIGGLSPLCILFFGAMCSIVGCEYRPWHSTVWLFICGILSGIAAVAAVLTLSFWLLV